MKNAIQKKRIDLPVESLIRFTRNQKIMLDHDLAKLYGVETKVLNQAVRRNIERFPEDFMFRLTQKEAETLRTQFISSRINRGQNVKYAPYAFTEHGIAMLSSVLNSPRAIQMNIMIVRAFMRMRELIATHKDLAVRMEKLEQNHERTGSVIKVLIEDIDKLGKEIHWIKNPPLKPKYPIGFVGSKRVEE